MRKATSCIPFSVRGENVRNDRHKVNLESILSEKSIATVFHPIVSLREQRIVGVEALSRGIDPTDGTTVLPEALFGQARRYGQALALDRLCRRKSMSVFEKLFGKTSRLTLWLNFDPGILDETRNPAGTLLRQASECRLDPRRIVIEIVESRANDDRALDEFIKFYRRAGFLIAIDDWGEAYSNMDRIYRVKPDIIKIHHSLACELDRDGRKKELVGAMLGLARDIGALSVVEGIETQEAAFVAKDLGASFVQGFYFCRPTECPFLIERECSDKLGAFSKQCECRRFKMFDCRRRCLEKFDAAVREIEGRLFGCRHSEFEKVLETAVAINPELECAYIIGSDGIQLTRAIYSPRLCKQDSPLFQPPGKGADRSAEDFFLRHAGGECLSVSAPCTSPVTGCRCVTISRSTTRTDGRAMVLCIDCHWHERGRFY